MRSRNASPQTSPQVVRRFRAEESREQRESPAGVPPSPVQKVVRVDDITNKSMNILHTYQASPVSNSREVSPGPSLLSPIPNGVRRVSGGDSAGGTPLRQNGMSQSPVLSPVDENLSGSQWSSAIGGATVSGKSGRVIERLMAENDRLKRELGLQVLKVQELEKTTQTFKPQIQALLEKVDSLTHASTMDSNLIQRRDRRIDELKVDNTHLKEGREHLQKRLRDVERDRDEIQEQGRRDVQSMTDTTKHATTHAEILAQSHRQLAAEYRARREKWDHDIRTVNEQHEADQQHIAQLDVVCNQMRQEAERTRKIQAEMVNRWQEFENELKLATQKEEEATRLATQKYEEMERVTQEMKWVVGVQRARAASHREGPGS